MAGYIDDDFILYGKQPTIGNRTIQQSATQTLAAATSTDADAYRKHLENILASDSDETLAKSINVGTFLDKHKISSYENNANLGFDLKETGGNISPTNGFLTDSDSGVSVSGTTRNKPDAQWFTKSVHLDKMGDYELSVNKRSIYDKISSDGIKKLEDDKPSRVSSVDALVKDYFPLTLGAAHNLKALEPLSSSEFNQTANSTLAKTTESSGKTSHLKPKPSKSPRSHKSTNNSSSLGLISKASDKKSKTLEDLFLFTTEAPVTGRSTVFTSSPYQHELARLRMERLRIEEEHLLEVKRQEELERIRGPQPKWYEMKSPQFHYEAHKNNELLANKPEWQSLMDYRTELLRASNDFKKTFNYDSQ